MIDIAVRRLRDDAHMPHQAYEGDAGFDLAACERVVLGPGERAMVATGIAVEIPEGYAGFVQPRSGLAARHGIGLVNSPGLRLGSGASGRWCARRDPRIAQLVVGPVTAARMIEVDELAGSERGARGFGSSSS